MSNIIKGISINETTSRFCEEGQDACFVLLNSQPFRKTAAEKILYKIYHQVIAEFFHRRVIIGMKIVGLHIQEKFYRFSTNTTCIFGASDEEFRR